MTFWIYVDKLQFFKGKDELFFVHLTEGSNIAICLSINNEK